MRIYSVLAVEFAACLYNKIYTFSTLFVLKNDKKGYYWGCVHITGLRPQLFITASLYWLCQYGTLILIFILCMSFISFTNKCMIDGMSVLYVFKYALLDGWVCVLCRVSCLIFLAFNDVEIKRSSLLS